MTASKAHTHTFFEAHHVFKPAHKERRAHAAPVEPTGRASGVRRISAIVTVRLLDALSAPWSWAAIHTQEKQH